MYIYGASGHAKVIIEIAELSNTKISGIIDDNSQITSILEYPVTSINGFSFDEMIIGIGNNKIRKMISEKYINSKFPLLIHPKAVISSRATMRCGTVVMAGSVLNSHVSIGAHCILNTNCSVDHESVISDFVHIAPNVALAGNVKVGEGTSIGIGSSVIQNVTIGKWCTIGAGSVIIKDIPDFAVVVGNPGKIIKYNFPL